VSFEAAGPCFDLTSAVFPDIASFVRVNTAEANGSGTLLAVDLLESLAGKWAGAFRNFRNGSGGEAGETAHRSAFPAGNAMWGASLDG